MTLPERIAHLWDRIVSLFYLLIGRPYTELGVPVHEGVTLVIVFHRWYVGKDAFRSSYFARTIYKARQALADPECNVRTHALATCTFEDEPTVLVRIGLDVPDPDTPIDVAAVDEWLASFQNFLAALDREEQGYEPLHVLP